MKKKLFLNKQPKNFSTQQGSTLVEVIVAVFVLSFGVLSLMLAQLNAVNTSINAANQAEITRAVQNYIEVMRAQPQIAVETQDVNNKKVSFLVHRYGQFNTAKSSNCISDLGMKLTDSVISACNIKNGVITVSWQGHGVNSNSSETDAANNFTYSLSVENKQLPIPNQNP